MSNRLKIGITQGDTNGVGWEIILKIFADSRILELFTPVVYGSSVAAAHYQKVLAAQEYEPVRLSIVENAERAQQGRVNLVESGAKELSVTPGKPSKAGGEAAAAALRSAIEDLKSGHIAALVTAPIDKEMIQCDDFSYTGHTEFLAKATKHFVIFNIHIVQNLNIGCIVHMLKGVHNYNFYTHYRCNLYGSFYFDRHFVHIALGRAVTVFKRRVSLNKSDTEFLCGFF